MVEKADIQSKPYIIHIDVFVNDTLTSIYKKFSEQEGMSFAPRTEEEKTTTGSTDMGNFSYVVPTIHPG